MIRCIESRFGAWTLKKLYSTLANKKQVAQEIGILQCSLSRILKGDKASLLTGMLFARSMNKSVEDIFEIIEDKKPGE
ncbi:hypothetical protein GJ688_08795 [Heliobacillus mobilis]|uniref:Uncharacterized protein n=1 Tax=Heliobacterium mobile TaxID=28064 RepID=A0A6I3SJX2_HELMO|nr:hypothetical protein [Heliobacterium mobile]MTV49075.1 hypothetical protein [Heliobacterium mobile]